MACLARAEVFDPSEVSILHICARVVRRCFLFGDDPISGKNFNHRTVLELICSVSRFFPAVMVETREKSEHTFMQRTIQGLAANMETSASPIGSTSASDSFMSPLTIDEQNDPTGPFASKILAIPAECKKKPFARKTGSCNASHDRTP